MKRYRKTLSLPHYLFYNALLLGWVGLFHFSLGYGFKLLYAVVIFFLLKVVITVTPVFFRALIVFFTLVGLSYMPVGIIYGAPDVNVIGSLIYTNDAEAQEFISGISMNSWGLTVTLGLLGLILLFRLPGLTIRSRKVQFGILLLSTVILAWSPIHKGGSVRLPEVSFAKDFLVSWQSVVDDNGAWAKIVHQPAYWSPTTLPGQRQTYVLVIGESVRRDYLHAFDHHNRFPDGYTNTPWLDKAPATLYTGYTSAGASTMPSLTNTLAVRDGRVKLMNNSIITLAQSAGFETWWLSNQGRKGRHDSPVALIAKQADHTTFLKSGNSDDRSPESDDALLPILDEALSTPIGEKPKLIVLHLMGSHPRACIRSHDVFDVDMGAKEISCYVKSIAQTDDLLKYVADALSKQAGSWSMMYFSDHGLTYLDKDTPDARLTHSDKTRENYEVPFFILNAEGTEPHSKPDPISALDFMPLFADWLAVQDNHLPEPGSHTGQVLDFKGNYKRLESLPSVP